MLYLEIYIHLKIIIVHFLGARHMLGAGDITVQDSQTVLY